MANYYWGTPDTTVQFCEKKYDHVYWIAEYDNTYSALPYILLGLFLFNTKIKKIGIATIILGFSTAIMHGTLRYYGQWLDECSLLYISFETIRLIKKNIAFYYFPPIIISYFYFKDYYIFFLSTFTFLQLVIIYLVTNKKIPIKKNRLILTLNSSNSWHSVSSWHDNNPRKSIYITSEFKNFGRDKDRKPIEAKEVWF